MFNATVTRSNTYAADFLYFLSVGADSGRNTDSLRRVTYITDNYGCIADFLRIFYPQEIKKIF